MFTKPLIKYRYLRNEQVKQIATLRQRDGLLDLMRLGELLLPQNEIVRRQELITGNLC